MADLISKQQDCAFSSQQTKQIATIKWLLYKAYNNNVPEDLKEPFYFDKRPQEQPLLVGGKSGSIHLKPAVVYLLAKAELYCLTLANLYLDPNFHNLNHSGIIQALARKGVTLSDPHLTETVLLQTSPLKLTAHMYVIEAIMMLYAKETITSERVHAAIKKFSSSQQRSVNDSYSNSVIPQWNVSDYEQLLLLWISETVSALNRRIKQEQLLQSQSNEKDIPYNEKNKVDHFKQLPIRDLSELCDGVALCALVSYYCPQALQWQKIIANKPATNADYNHNLHMFYNFCQYCLPYPVFHMLPQDLFPQSINYMRCNLTAMLADVFNVLEVRPANCVVSDNQNGTPAFSNSESSNAAQFEPAYARRNGYNNLQKRPLTTQQMSVIPNLRNYSSAQNSNSTESRTANSSPRVDRKSRNNSVSESQNNPEQFVVHKGRNIPTLSSMGSENCHKERAETVAAGKPSNWNDVRKSQTSVTGRRSRRNSFSDDSQLTIENFGGSQENISVLGRNPDKEPAVHVVKPVSDDTVDGDASSRQLRCQMAAQENWSSAAISNLLRDPAPDNALQRPSSNASAASTGTTASSGSGSEKMNGMRNFTVPAASNASALPSAETAEMLENCKVSSQMLNIRLKLEEKRRQIEMDKRRTELDLKKKRQKLNKAAFLQAVSKIENENNVTNKNDNDDGDGGGGDNDNSSYDDIDNDSIIAYDEIDRSALLSNQVEQKWLKNNESDINGDISPRSDRQTPDSDTLDIEKYQKSISEMDSSLHAIQNDLQWLAVKETEMLQAPELPTHTPELTQPYSRTFILNQESQAAQNQTLQKMLGHQNQNGFFPNTIDYNVNDGRANYNTLPANKNFVDYNYAENYAPHPQPHHLSLMPTVAKSPIPAPTPPPPSSVTQQMMAPAYDNDPYYVYHQMQPQPMHLPPSHPAPNFKYSYHSMNVVDHANFNMQDDKDKMKMHQTRNDQFYLHKPSESVPMQSAFQFQTPSSYTTSPATVTSFGQRKTWESSSSSSPIHSPPHIFTPPRYPSGKDNYSSPFKPAQAMSKYADEQYNLGASTVKRAYSHDDPVTIPSEMEYANYFTSTRGEKSGRHSAGSVSVPSPSADDMAPQCISFIGCQSDSGKASGAEEQNDDVQLLNESVNKLHINNGSRTYRIPSPTNKHLNRPNSHSAFTNEDNSKSEKGFYVSFSSNDDDNIGKPSNLGFTRFSDRSPIKVPPRFKRLNSAANSNSAQTEKKPVVRSRFEPIKKPEVTNFGTEKTHRQNSDEANNDRCVEKISDETILIKNRKSGDSSVGLVINADMNNDPATVDEMERKKERILLQSLQRRQQQEEIKARKEIEMQRLKEKEKQKGELKAKKKEEEKRRRAVILEKHRLKKMIEEAEREGKPIDKELLNAYNTIPKSKSESNTPALPKLRNKNHITSRPRPKTIHIDMGSNLKDPGGDGSMVNFSLSKKGSSMNLAEHHGSNNYGISRRDYYRGSQDCLLAANEMGNTAGTSASSIYSDLTDEDRASSYQVNGSTCGSIGRRRGTSYKTSRDVSLDRATSRIARPKFSTYQSYPRKSSSLMNLCGSSCDQDSLSYNSRYVTDTDSGLGRATPPHRTSSPGPCNSSPSGPGSLPPSHHSRRLRYDDTASESGGSEYSGLRLYKQPTVKSNRGIVMNAIEYCVFPGEVNRNAKNRILEEISRSDATKHFLVLFRDARCQFRALYSYFPENEEVFKLYGTGPKQVTEKMFDKFFKYNSGGKCFAQVHTKHLTVTIDAFTIHNSLWQGKKVNLPNKRDMSLVI